MLPLIPAPGPDVGIVILTGAGISKESGLDTFRCEGGIWSQVRLEDVATPEGFAADPHLVHEFYNARRASLTEPDIQPNPAHHALVELERRWPGPVLLVTQNIDDLHERAGSRNLIHMHGELMKLRCDLCGCAPFHWATDAHPDTPCPHCHRAGGLRPHVVWFGEVPLEMERITQALAECALFMSIGTSGEVYPAAGFVALARQVCAQTVELNLEPSRGASLFAHARRGPASVAVPAFVAELLAAVADA